ncbi:MAG: type I restriction enzyme HsdR N-terminal domain-containing protein [Pedobacter sp.]|nr:MAG: type I restriction enzyme HsdR N-terminal domain-containing protein [Pedobacter sp.]
MIKLEFPDPSTFQIKMVGSTGMIFDTIRKGWFVLTEEEWVRQNFVNYLIKVQSYPATLIAMEKMITLGELNKRFDILVYDQQHQPFMMVECKAPSVPLTENVLHQLLRYHISVPAGYLIITNGSNTYGWVKKNNALELLEEIPAWENTVEGT